VSYSLLNEIIIMIFCLIGSAFFSASETALTSMSKLRIKRFIGEYGKKAKVMEKWLHNSEDILITLLIGNNLVNICAASICTLIVSELVGYNLVGKVTGITTGVLTFIILVFGEITPKTFAHQNAEKIALLIIGPLHKISLILKPLIAMFRFIARVIIKFFGGNIKKRYSAITEHELVTLLDVGESEGILEEEERDMIHGVMEFADTVVHKVMIPRVDMKVIENNVNLKEAISFAVDFGHSRIPVYEENIDDIIGVLYVKDIMKYIGEDNFDAMLVKDLCRKPCYISKNKKLDDTLKEFKEEQVHMAIVVDEYGGTLGLVTIEDLLEEIVGEIEDEYDIKRVELFELIDENTVIVDAKISIDELNEKFDLNISEQEEYDSLGGFINSIKEDVAEKGDIIEYESFVFTVLEADEKRVLKVKIERKKGEQNHEK
jgi:putative hemolysin